MKIRIAILATFAAITVVNAAERVPVMRPPLTNHFGTNTPGLTNRFDTNRPPFTNRFGPREPLRMPPDDQRPPPDPVPRPGLDPVPRPANPLPPPPLSPIPPPGQPHSGAALEPDSQAGQS